MKEDRSVIGLFSPPLGGAYLLKPKISLKTHLKQIEAPEALRDLHIFVLHKILLVWWMLNWLVSTWRMGKSTGCLFITFISIFTYLCVLRLLLLGIGLIFWIRHIRSSLSTLIDRRILNLKNLLITELLL